MHLSGRRIAGEHRDEGGRLGDCRRHRRAEGVQEGFGAAQGGVRHCDLILHGIQARHVPEDHSLPAGDDSRSRRDSPHSAVFPPLPALGPRGQPKRASRVSRSVAAGRSPGARIRRRAARPLRPRRISRGSSAWRPAAAGFGRVRAHPGSRANSATQFGERAERSQSAALFGASLRPRHEGLDPSVGALALVAVGGGDALSVVERRSWLSQAARPRSMRRRGWCKAAREPGRRAAAAQPRGSKQIHCRERVVAVMRGTACGLEVTGRPARQRARPGFGGPQFTQIPDGLFEVVAEDLRACGGRFPEHVLEPVGEAVVQFGPK